VSKRYTTAEMRELIAEERARKDPADAYLAAEMLADMLEQALGPTKLTSRIEQLFGRDVQLADIPADEIEKRATSLVDEANGLYADAERLQGELLRRRMAAGEAGDVAALLTRIATELGHPPKKKPFFYTSRGEWVIEWADRTLGLSGEMFVSVENAQAAEEFAREEMREYLATPLRDLEQRG
jgi:hypothetical protein